MAVPPQFRKAAGRRLQAPVPTNKAGGTKKVATFANPGNKAGQGLTQQVDSAAEEGAETPAPSALGALMSMGKRPKTKVHPAASRKLQAMKMAARNNAPSR